MYYSTDYSSPIGEMLIVSDGEAICGVWFYGQKYFKSTIDEEPVINDDLAIFKQVKQWFDDYFNGLNPEIDFEIRLQGSEFRQKVWKILTEIPYGESITYGEIASRISPEMSAQAVGGAVDTLVAGMSGIFSQLTTIIQAELEIQTAEIEKKYDREISIMRNVKEAPGNDIWDQ